MIDQVSNDRGVSRSTPKVAISDKPEGVATWLIKQDVAPLPNETSDAIAQLYARSTVFNAVVDARIHEAASHVSTAAVARDMLEMSKQFGFDRLQYWGFS